jgi:hypothetical protein
MIVFQSLPTRLYPKIIEAILDQYDKVTYLHELYILKDENGPNPLGVTKADYIAPRASVTCGIFPSKKVPKKDGDFWFTIDYDDRETWINEMLAGIHYFGSERFRDKEIQSSKTHEDYLYFIYNVFNDMTHAEKLDFYESGKLLKYLSRDLYRIRPPKYGFPVGFLDNMELFDYVGKYSNMKETVEYLKNKINLDLSHLLDENPYSFKKEWNFSK